MRNGEAASAGQALSRLRAAHAEGDPYGIALIDYEMPDRSGEDLAREIRADPDLKGTVLLLISSVEQPVRQPSDSELFQARLLKPVRQSALFDALLTSWAERSSAVRPPAPAAAAASPPPPRLPPARVLVVDDNDINQRVAEHLLTRLGCQVDVAGGGEEALRMAGERTYALIFMDCEMAGLDGFETTRVLRAREGDGRHTPVVALTAHAMRGDRERCIAAGMDDYLSKPLDRTAVREVVERWQTPARG